MRLRKRTRRGCTRGRNKEHRKLGSRVKDEGQTETWTRYLQALHSSIAKIVLHPDPRAVEAKVPSVTNWITVPLNNHNALPALINGHPSVMYVDSGTTSTMIAHRIAGKLGLLEKVCLTKSYEVQLWTTKERHNLKVVKNVEVQLAGGVTLSCTFFVFPKDMVSKLPDILLDNWTLRQAGAIQEFTASACNLYFPTKKPSGTAMKDRDYQCIGDVSLRRSMMLRNKKMTIHVDTGATSFYISPRCMYTRLCLTQAPRCVSLVLAEGVVVTSGFVRVAGTDTFDFVIGKEMLSRYRCFLDFASNSLYFNVNRRVFRVKLKKSSRV